MIGLRAIGEWKEERKAGVQECVAKDIDEEVDCHVRGLAMTCVWRVYLGSSLTRQAFEEWLVALERAYRRRTRHSGGCDGF